MLPIILEFTVHQEGYVTMEIYYTLELKFSLPYRLWCLKAELST